MKESIQVPIRPVWALITGIVRDEAFLLERLKFFNSLKKSGHIEQVVFSTWKGEIQNFESVLNIFREYDFILVESDQPDIVCLGHYIHQMVALRNGLELCPNDVFVLRTRTDKCGPESGVHEEEITSLLRERNYARSCKEDFGIFDYKIGTFAYHTTVSNSAPAFFFWHDRAYLGLKEDLQKFINFNVLSFSYSNIIPEQAFFSSAFINQWPIFQLVFESFNQKQIVEKIYFNSEHAPEKISLLTNFLLSKKLFRHAFLIEKYLLHKYFFDIRSGNDFGLETNYRGVELHTESEMNDLLLPCKRGRVRTNDYSDEMREIKKYMEINFSVSSPEIEIKDLQNKYYAIATPSSNISLVTRN